MPSDVDMLKDKHLLNVFIQAIEYLIPVQTSVIGFDQPLYALAKKLQWYLPAQYGKEKLIVMLGSLHIEMATLSFIGDWLQDSGWTTALSNSGVTTSGNESLLSGHNVASTKYVHQVTAYTLYQLMQQSLQKAKGNVAGFRPAPRTVE